MINYYKQEVFFLFKLTVRLLGSSHFRSQKSLTIHKNGLNTPVMFPLMYLCAQFGVSHKKKIKKNDGWKCQDVQQKPQKRL